MELELGRKHLAFGVTVIILLVVAVPFLNVPLPGLYTIHSAGIEVISGDTINSTDGLILTMDYLDAAADNVCNLWDIEEGAIVEVGSFSVDNYGAAIWTFTLDNVRAETYPYKLVLAGDLEGESFTFYINGGEGENGGDETTETTTETTETTETTTTTDTEPEPVPTLVDAPLIPTELQWILLAAVLIGIYFLEKRRREQ